MHQVSIGREMVECFWFERPHEVIQDRFLIIFLNFKQTFRERKRVIVGRISDKMNRSLVERSRVINDHGAKVMKLYTIVANRFVGLHIR